MAHANDLFASLLARMSAAICGGDAEAAAACFTHEGVCHDGFAQLGFPDERILKSVKRWAGA